MSDREESSAELIICFSVYLKKFFIYTNTVNYMLKLKFESYF